MCIKGVRFYSSIFYWGFKHNKKLILSSVTLFIASTIKSLPFITNLMIKDGKILFLNYNIHSLNILKISVENIYPSTELSKIYLVVYYYL